MVMGLLSIKIFQNFQNKWCTSFEELANPIRDGKRLFSPDFGWMYV